LAIDIITEAKKQNIKMMDEQKRLADWQENLNRAQEEMEQQR